MPEKPFSLTPRWSILLSGGLLVLLVAVAYHGSYSVPLIFDDGPAIIDNPTIRTLWPIWKPLMPPTDGSGVTGRPLVNLSLAVNFALGGTDVRGYHAFNLGLHLLAGLTLFGIVRRTLLQPALRGRFGADALPLALAVAILWSVHPLQTESVVCIVQRTELLVGLFYLQTFYCFIRGAESSASRPWWQCAVLACLLGMASKEVMVSAPLLVLLYDRAFVAGTFREAWRQHRRLYLGMAGTWLLLAYLVAGMGGTRGSAAGLGLGIPWWAYSLKQCQAIIHYLQLVIWPHPLVLYYGTGVIYRLTEVLPQVLGLSLLVAGTIAGLIRWPKMGFLGAWFFAILAPSSSVIPLVTQTMAEHRMYLPLAAVVAMAAIGGYRAFGRQCLFLGGALALALACVTMHRNADYRSEFSIWADTVAKQPGNAQAHTELGTALNRLNRQTEAFDQYREAVRIDPSCAIAQSNLGEALYLRGQNAEAIAHCEAALRSKPDLAEAHTNLAAALLKADRIDEALEHAEAALKLKPNFVAALCNSSRALLRQGRIAASIQQSEAALRLKADSVEALDVYGDALLVSGRPAEAIPRFEAALRLQPDLTEIHGNLGKALYQTGRFAEALPQFEIALHLQPDSADIHADLGSALYQNGRIAEAIAQYEEALRLKPTYPVARANLERLRAVRQPAPPAIQ